MSNFINKICFSNFTNCRSSLRTVRVSATTGVVPPDVIPVAVETIGVPPEVAQLVARLDGFEGTLQPVPASTAAEYATINEANASVVWAYAKAQATKNLIGKVAGFTGDANIMFDASAYCPGGTSYVHTTALTNCKKVFSRGKWANFWPAVSIRVQNFRDQEQRINPQLGITPAEFAEIKDNLVYIGRGYAYSALTTSSKNYILNTPVSAKKADAVAFNNWVRTKSHVIVKIIRLNVSDIPFGYAPKQIQAFEMNPDSAANRAALEASLLQLQKEALVEYRARVAAGTQATFNFEEWLAGK